MALKLFLISFILTSLLFTLLYIYTYSTSFDINILNQSSISTLAIPKSINNTKPYPVSFAYLISASKGDTAKLKRTIHALYHPGNFYLIHLEREATEDEHREIARFVTDNQVFQVVGNVMIVGKPNRVTYRGPTMLATTLHAMAILLRIDAKWDWFINLSASDYPLVTQDDLISAFSVLPRHLNFIQHSSRLGWKFCILPLDYRKTSFGIPLHSLFEAKGIAGNIVHAVATTNAIIAGLIVIEAIKVLRNDAKNCRMTYCLEHPARKMLLMPVEPFEPNKSCYVCSETPLLLEVNTQRAKLRDVVEKVVTSKLGMNLPLITHGSSLLYEVGDDLDQDMVANYEANLEKVLSELPYAITGGTVITVEDLQQELVCNINIKHREKFDEEKEPDGMVLHGWTQQAPAAKNKDTTAATNGGATTSTTSKSAPNISEEDDLTILEAGIETISPSKKRKLSDLSNPEEKRAKKIPDDDVIVMLDDISKQ